VVAFDLVAFIVEKRKKNWNSCKSNIAIWITSRLDFFHINEQKKKIVESISTDKRTGICAIQSLS
jgi:hypothetical protein